VDRSGSGSKHRRKGLGKVGGSVLRQLIRKPRAVAGMAVVSGNTIGAVGAFLAALVAARTLSLDDFAAFGVALAVNSLCVQFADLGVGLVSVAEVSESRGLLETRRKLKKLATYRIATAILVMAAAELLIALLPDLAPYRVPAMLGAAGALVGVLNLFVVAGLQALHNFTFAGAIQAVTGGLRLFLVGSCALLGLDAGAMVVAYAIVSPAIAFAIGLFPLLHAVSSPNNENSALLSKSAHETNYGLNAGRQRILAASGILSALTLNIGLLLLPAFATPVEVAAYSGAWRFAAGVLLVNTAIASALLPFILRSIDPWSETKKLLLLGSAGTVIWLALLPGLLWLGPLVLGDVGALAEPALRVLLVAFALDALLLTVYQTYLRVQRPMMVLSLAAVQLVGVLVLTLAFASEGALAAAYGQLGARILGVLLLLAPIVMQARGHLSWFTGSEEQMR